MTRSLTDGQFSIGGRLESAVIHRDGSAGTSQVAPNMVVDSGRLALAKALTGGASAKLSFAMVGSGAARTNASMNQLESPIDGRIEIEVLEPIRPADISGELVGTDSTLIRVDRGELLSGGRPSEFDRSRQSTWVVRVKATCDLDLISRGPIREAGLFIDGESGSFLYNRVVLSSPIRQSTRRPVELSWTLLF